MLLKRIVWGLIVLLAISIAISDPAFTAPTLSNGYSTTDRAVVINVSIVETVPHNLTFMWDNINYTLYDNSTLLMMGFNNFSAIGENENAAVDVSQYARNATIYGALFNVTGKYLGAYSFNGSTYIKTNQSLLNNMSNFTIGGWIYAQATGNRIGFFGQNDVIEIGFSDSNTIKVWTSRGGEISWTIDSSIFPLGSWNYVTFTGNSVVSPYLNIYINGKNRSSGGSTTNNFGSSVFNFSIGGGGVWDPTGNNLTGMIDEVIVLNRTLSAQEVYEFYASNLYKKNQTQWYFYINQSYNATDLLPYASYPYQFYSEDSARTLTSTEERTVMISQPAAAVPEWNDFALLMILGIVIGGFLVVRRQ